MKPYQSKFSEKRKLHEMNASEIEDVIKYKQFYKIVYINQNSGNGFLQYEMKNVSINYTQDWGGRISLKSANSQNSTFTIGFAGIKFIKDSSNRLFITLK